MEKKNKYFIQDGMISKFDFMSNQEFYPLPTLCNLLNKQDEEYDNLAKEFVIVSKALELACEEQDLYWFNKYAHEQGITLIEYLKTKAKEKARNA